MSYYIPLPCCECTASTNPCDLPCLVSAVATISGNINIDGVGIGNRYESGGLDLTPVPFTYSFNFSLDDEINLNSSGNGQTNSVIALFNQEFEYSAGENCGGDECTGSTLINGNVTTGLSCPANVCIGGQQFQAGTSLTFELNNLQSTNCSYSVPPSGDFDDHITEYYCDEKIPLDSLADVGLGYVACSPNSFTLNFGNNNYALLNISTTQQSGYTQIGQIFIDNLPPQPLYGGYGGADGVTSKIMNGSLNVVIERVIGYIKDGECVAP
jgi:hypothetical protein